VNKWPRPWNGPGTAPDRKAARFENVRPLYNPRGYWPLGRDSPRYFFPPRGRRPLKPGSNAQAAERRQEEDYTFGAAPTVPRSLWIPLKPTREGAEPQADLEDEFFGGFAIKDSELDDGVVWRDAHFGNARGAPRLGAASGRASTYLASGSDRSARYRLPRAVGQPSLAAIVTSNGTRFPESRSGCGAGSGHDRQPTPVSLEWLQHKTSRRRPSRVLEAKRFPQLPKIETKLLPKEGPGENARRLEARALAERLTQGAAVTPCPSEWTTSDLEKIIAKYKNRKRPGRAPLGECAMTPAERKRRQRQKLNLIDTPPPPGERRVDDTSECNSSNLDQSPSHAGRPGTPRASS
jgi:hypothetical protein